MFRESFLENVGTGFSRLEIVQEPDLTVSADLHGLG